MTKNENKTVPTETDVDTFISSLDDVQQQEDSRELVRIMRTVTDQKPVLWGSAIIGFGSLHYKSKSGREGDWMKIGFAPRKGQLSLYMTFDAANYSDELNTIGKHKIGKGCIYLKKLSDANLDLLTKFIRERYAEADDLYTQNYA